MKLLILLLISTNALAQWKVKYSANPDSVGGQSFTEETEALAIERLVKLSKKKGWRKGEWTQVAEGALYSKEVTCDEFEPDCVAGTFYYHPTNWSYTAPQDITDELADKKAKKDKRETDLEALKPLIIDGSAKLKDIVDYLKLRDNL